MKANSILYIPYPDAGGMRMEFPQSASISKEDIIEILV